MKLFNRISSTAAQAAVAYERDGVALVRDVLPEQTIAAARVAWRQLKVDISEGRSPLHRADRFISGGSLPKDLDSVPSAPELVKLATAVLGPDVALYMNRLLVKDDLWNGPVFSHQDCVYFHGGIDKLSIFVPLEPFTAETGGLTWIKGSHAYGNLGLRGAVRHENAPELEHVTLDAQPGDVILASFTVWHYSAPAAVACDRPVLQIAYQPATDGSYFGEPDAARLISGRWRTSFFSRFGDLVTT